MKYLLFIMTALISMQSFASIGQITAINGSATIERNQTQIKAKLGLKIDEHDLITTSNKTLLQIVFNDQTTVTLGSNTHLSVAEYRFGNATDSKADFKLAKGFFKAMSGKIGKLAPQNFKVKTKTATIGIRGTYFTVVTNERFTRLATFKGATYLSDNATGATYEVPKGKQLSFNHSSGKATIATAAPSSSKDSSSPTSNATEDESSTGTTTDTEKKDSTNDTSSESTQEETSNDTNEDSTGDTTSDTTGDTTGEIMDPSQEVEDETSNDTTTQQNAKITEGSATYTSYGYWLNEETAEITGVWIEGAPQTNPDIINNYIGTGAKSEYQGSLIAVDQNNNLAKGEIQFVVDFDKGTSAVEGDIDYTFNKGTSKEVRWDVDFKGAVAPDGFTVTDFSKGHDVENMSGTLEGKFYGSNGQEVGGTFDLEAQNKDTGVVESSSGSYNATSKEVQGIKP